VQLNDGHGRLSAEGKYEVMAGGGRKRNGRFREHSTSKLTQRRSGVRLRSTRSTPWRHRDGTTVTPRSLVNGDRAAASFDQLVGSGEQRGRYFETERLGRLQVDDELENRGLLDR
jgi:hypothetical protein